MDSAARWFMAGILVSLVNTGLVIAFIGIPGVTDDDDDDDAQVVEAAAAAAAGVTDARVTALLDDLGARIDRLGVAAGAPAAAGQPGAGALDLVGPRFAPVDAARLRLRQRRHGLGHRPQSLELWRVDLRGRTESESLEGIEDLGESAVVDVDVTADGTLYALVRDGAFEWRLFLRFAGGEWALMASSELSRWPAEVAAVSVAESGSIYLTASQPAGLFRLVAPFDRVSNWVPGQAVQGVDTAADDSLQLYAAPQNTPLVPADQVGFSRDGRFGSWPSEYAVCSAASSTQPDAAGVAPQFPRDVAIVDAETALIADSLNHVIRLQREDGAGRGGLRRALRARRRRAAPAQPERGGDRRGRQRLHRRQRQQPRGGAARADGRGARRRTARLGRGRVRAAERLPAVGAALRRRRPAPARRDARGGGRSGELQHQLGLATGRGLRARHRVANIGTAILGGVAETPGADRTIMDPNARVATSPDLPFAPDGATAWSWDTTGVAPGTYLVICTFQPHFEVGMYGWVIVQ